MLQLYPISADEPPLHNTLPQIEDAVFTMRPILGQIYRHFGNATLAEFTRKQWDISGDTLPQTRKQEVISVITKHTQRLLGKSIAQEMKKQLEKKYAVITADHHGPLTDPGFFTNNLLTAIANKKENTIIPVLSCANISFDNDSFPRGLLFHSMQKGKLTTNQLVFFPRKVRPLTVANHPAYEATAIQEAKKRVLTWQQTGVITKQTSQKLEDILTTIYADPDVLRASSFSDQVTKTNFLLWKKVFPGITDLVYLQQEEIVNALLLKHHLKSETIINRILFDNTYHEKIVKYFDGISGGFSLKNLSGTFLFWALPKDQKYRVQLWKKGNMLVSSDNSYQLSLTPEELEQALREKELLPSTLLSFILLSLYYGITLVGGGGQTTYLTQMKDAYSNMNQELGNNEDEPPAPTDRQAIVYPSVAFAVLTNNGYVAATPLDVFLYGNPTATSAIEQMSNTVTVKQALARALPIMYKALYQKEEVISKEAIDTLTGFTSRIQTIGEIQ